jgi:hypothetical protein
MATAVKVVAKKLTISLYANHLRQSSIFETTAVGSRQDVAEQT